MEPKKQRGKNFKTSFQKINSFNDSKNKVVLISRYYDGEYWRKKVGRIAKLSKVLDIEKKRKKINYHGINATD